MVGIIGLLAAVAVPVSAQGKGKSGKPDTRASSASTANVTVVFRDSDQSTFREYFRRNRITATALPPGIAKNLARGKPLPPGIAKRAVPPALLAQGPKVSPDITFTIAGNVVVAMRRDVVIDILRNVF
jgi:hypothetical protein